MGEYWVAAPLIALALGAFFGLIGPFGAYDRLGMWPRVGNWLIITTVGTLVFGLVRALHPVFRVESWAHFALTVLTGSIPLSVFVGWITGKPLHGQAMSHWPVEYAQTALISSICLGAIYFALVRSREQKTAQAAAPPRPPRGSSPTLTPLHQRLPAAARQDSILALRTDDHYVHVYTDKGAHMILLRFKDALAELQTLDGAQVHRSWWVARDAVDGVERDGERYELRLSNGETAPVARRRLASLRSEGWLDRRSSPPQRRKGQD